MRGSWRSLLQDARRQTQKEKDCSDPGDHETDPFFDPYPIPIPGEDPVLHLDTAAVVSRPISRGRTTRQKREG
ncbi:hypothetical protein PLACP1_16590 [Planifilum fimeticola]